MDYCLRASALLLLWVLIPFSGASRASQIAQYQDLTLWESAVSSFQVEAWDFAKYSIGEPMDSPATDIQLDGFVLSMSACMHVRYVGGGSYDADLHAYGTGGCGSYSFNFAQPTTALAFYYSGAYDDMYSVDGVRVHVGGEIFELLGDGLFAITTKQPFTTIFFDAIDTGGDFQNYHSIGTVFHGFAVPEPHLAMLLAIMAIVALRRKIKTQFH